jgi:hypothetical protein
MTSGRFFARSAGVCCGISDPSLGDTLVGGVGDGPLTGGADVIGFDSNDPGGYRDGTYSIVDVRFPELSPV